MDDIDFIQHEEIERDFMDARDEEAQANEG